MRKMLSTLADEDVISRSDKPGTISLIFTLRPRGTQLYLNRYPGEMLSINGCGGTKVLNPKQERHGPTRRAALYPYYAGFSQHFARSLISSLALPRGSRILDPWNGSGTTMTSSVAEGYTGVGYDINPVMVIAAKARLLGWLTEKSLRPLLAEISSAASRNGPPLLERPDPLSVWLTDSSCSAIRQIEASLQHLLVKPRTHTLLSDNSSVDELSDLASFFYVALFRGLRSVLSTFFATNPTWVKRPKSRRERRCPSFDLLLSTFQDEVLLMALALEREKDCAAQNASANVAVASSDCLPLQDGSIDCVITSPPYCTRIDYAVATSIELALLGIDPDHGLNQLRRAMIGTSTVPSVAHSPSPAWGDTCLNFLLAIERHPSKASSGYYLKNHLQYFHGMFKSIAEISRVMRPGGVCALVVQDSHYKELRNDLPRICVEMGASNRLRLRERADFEQANTMAGLNPRARQYRFKAQALESVLLLNRA